MTLPLAHLRVIDLTRARAGPTLARQFADWGADVIMVESLGRKTSSPEGGSMPTSRTFTGTSAASCST